MTLKQLLQRAKLKQDQWRARKTERLEAYDSILVRAKTYGTWSIPISQQLTPTLSR